MGQEFSPVSAMGIILDGDQCHVFTAEGDWPLSGQWPVFDQLGGTGQMGTCSAPRARKNTNPLVEKRDKFIMRGAKSSSRYRFNPRPACVRPASR